MYWGLSRDSENGMKAELGPMSVQGEAVGSKTRKGENKATAVKAVALSSHPFCVLNHAPVTEHHRFTRHFINKFKLKTVPYFNPLHSDYLYVRGRKVGVWDILEDVIIL